MHVNDPCGFTVEMLQTTFEDNEGTRKTLLQKAGAGAKTTEDAAQGPPAKKSKAAEDAALGQPAKKCMGQLTTRSNDIDVSLDFYCNILGMKLVCVEPVTQHGF